jgi:hypothetical protein
MCTRLFSNSKVRKN